MKSILRIVLYFIFLLALFSVLLIYTGDFLGCYSMSEDGVNTALEKRGQKDERDHHQRNRRHPFVAGNCQPHMAGRVTTHSHELFRRNIRCNE